MERMQFSSLFLKEEIFSEYHCSDDDSFLRNLSDINIFIGKNNTGKSRFLRKVFQYGDLKFLSHEQDIIKLDQELAEFLKKFDELRLNRNSGNFFTEIEPELKKYKPYQYLKKHVDNNLVRNIFESIFNYNPEAYQTNFNAYMALQLAHETYENHEKFFPDKSGVSRFDYSSVYIPILRGLRPIHKNSAGKFDNIDNYLSRTTYDYFNGQEGNAGQKIYTGLDFYDSLRNHRDGDSVERAQIRDFELFLSTAFFDGETVELIPRRGGNDVYVKVGNTEEPVHKLGDGIQAIIILTYPLFFNQDKLLKVFIEEPELHLHPGYQRIFIETIKRKEFSNFQYFITTHSNHFLDMTLDTTAISVYTFEKEDNSTHPRFTITNVENDKSKVLSLIGVRNSSVFLCNCTIWVEGISDRIYIRKYMELIQQEKQKKYKEDTHFSFVEYGGNNITHWSFLENEDNEHQNINVERLCGRLLLISDNDGAGLDNNGTVLNGKEKKHLRFNQLKNILGDRYILLKVREIENLLTDKILCSVVSSYERDNIVDLSKISFEKYKNEKLGKYLDDNIEHRNRAYSGDGGTIKDKVSFAKKAVAAMQCVDDMSNEAKSIAEKIYEFIKSNN